MNVRVKTSFILFMNKRLTFIYLLPRDVLNLLVIDYTSNFIFPEGYRLTYVYNRLYLTFICHELDLIRIYQGLYLTYRYLPQSQSILFTGQSNALLLNLYYLHLHIASAIINWYCHMLCLNCIRYRVYLAYINYFCYYSLSFLGMYCC